MEETLEDAYKFYSQETMPMAEYFKYIFCNVKPF